MGFNQEGDYGLSESVSQVLQFLTWNFLQIWTPQDYVEIAAVVTPISQPTTVRPNLYFR